MTKTVQVYAMGSNNPLYEGNSIRLARNAVMNFKKEKPKKDGTHFERIFEGILEEVIGPSFDLIVGTEEYLGFTQAIAVELLNILGSKSPHDP